MNYFVENIAPVLCVSDIALSVNFYVNSLGFEKAEWGDDKFTSVNKDGACIYLCKEAQGNRGTWIWLGFDGDIHCLHKELKENGVKILLPPANFPWAFEMHVEDPDGHVLRLGTEPDTKIPFADIQLYD